MKRFLFIMGLCSSGFALVVETQFNDHFNALVGFVVACTMAGLYFTVGRKFDKQMEEKTVE